MFNKTQRNKGYYRALRQNRKIINKRARKLDRQIAELTGETSKYSNSKDKINDTIRRFKEANFWGRFKFLFTHNIKSLA